MRGGGIVLDRFAIFIRSHLGIKINYEQPKGLSINISQDKAWSRFDRIKMIITSCGSWKNQIVRTYK